jgi:hypothetical protein
MGFSAKLFNATVKILKDACQGDGTQPIVHLSDMQARSVYQSVTPKGGADAPLLNIRLPDQPYRTSKWVATGNRREAIFTVCVDVICELAEAAEDPYGNDIIGGILELADEVQDLYESEDSRTAFITAAPKLVDYECVSMSHFKAESRVIASTITITFRLRYEAGNS